MTCKNLTSVAYSQWRIGGKLNGWGVEMGVMFAAKLQEGNLWGCHVDNTSW